MQLFFEDNPFPCLVAGPKILDEDNPISIEDDVMIAAGSTITKDLKSGELALTRAPLKIVKGFFYKFFSKK